MGKFIIPEIRDNYPLYTTLLKDSKAVFEEIIDISIPKKSNKNFLSRDNVGIKHITLTEEILFIADVKINDHKYFHFKLKCNSLCETPFFRYDSDGSSHRNYDDNIPLSEQLITTPHFNCFNEDGIGIAYKTDQLKDDKKRAALEDINLCMPHFCHESNMRLNDSEFPKISISQGTLPLTLTKDDPNSGVDFI